jgi:nitrilase
MRIAAAQVHAAWGRPEEGSERVAGWIRRAAADGVDLLAFGETHLGGYPFWLSMTDGSRFDEAGQKRAYAYYLAAAVELDGPELRHIREAAADHRVFTYLGIAERGSGVARGSVFATLVAIDPDRGIVSAHRKLQPTYEERLAWAAGDGYGLSVHATTGHGGDTMRVGGLNCWENWMPQARMAMYAGGEDIHVSVWPGAVRHTIDSTRFIALEGRVYSLAAGTLLSRADVPADFPLADALPDGDWADGGSAIAAPDGQWLREPVGGTEGLVVADVDLARVREERQNFDPTGHYARPDVFELRVDRRRQEITRFRDDPSERD